MYGLTSKKDKRLIEIFINETLSDLELSDWLYICCQYYDQDC